MKGTKGTGGLPRKVGAALKTGPTHSPTNFFDLVLLPVPWISSSTIFACIKPSSASLHNVKSS